MSWVTEEQIKLAREVNLLSYMQNHEPDTFRRSGVNRYCHVVHDSFVIQTDVAPDRWYWNSQSVKGRGALDYLVKVQQIPFTQAVEELGGKAASLSHFKIPAKEEMKKAPFCLPVVDKYPNIVNDYLHKRGLPYSLIGHCIRRGLLYQDQKDKACVFVGKDNAGIPRFASRRLTHDGKYTKYDVDGSDKRYSFCLPPKKSGTKHVAIFEAPIDALSHAALQMLQGFPWNGYRLSLGGTSEVALIAFLKRHPEIIRVTLHLDNDRPGLNAAARIKTLLHRNERFQHIRVSIKPPHRGADYNQDLQNRLTARMIGRNSRQPVDISR